MRQHVEFKARREVGSAMAQDIVSKGTIFALLTTGKITKKAKILLDEAGIRWIEGLPEEEIYNYDGEY